MKRITVAIATTLLAACGGGGEDAADGAIGIGEGPAGGGGAAGAPAPPAASPGPGPANLALDLSRVGSASADVAAFRFAARKIAFHMGDPTEPLFEGVAGEPTPCEASPGTFVTDAPSEPRVEFGMTDARLRLGGLDVVRAGQLVEAWILIERGSAQIERPGGQPRSVHLPVCRDAHGTIWSVVRAVSSRPLLVTEDGEATATMDLRASSFIVGKASCPARGAPPECASADDAGDDGDPGTRLVYTLHSLPMRAGP